MWEPVKDFVAPTHIVDGSQPESHLPVLVLTENNLSQAGADLRPPDADVRPRHGPDHPADTRGGGQCYLLVGWEKKKTKMEVGGRWERKNGLKRRVTLKIQLEIKRNAESNRGTWEDSISSPPLPLNESRNVSWHWFWKLHHEYTMEK